MHVYGKQAWPLCCETDSLNCETPRILLHPFFAAVEVLLHNVIRQPASPQATSDLHIVEPFLHLLEILAGDKRQCSRSEGAERMYGLCKELKGRAHEAVKQLDMSLSLGLISDLGQ
jgi:hypothetical protein